MPRTALQTIEIPLPERAGSRYERAALAPFPARLLASAWQAHRRPYAHATHVAVGGRLGRLQLGTEPDQAEISPTETITVGGAAPGLATLPQPKPAPSPRSPEISGHSAAYGDTRSYALTIQKAVGPVIADDITAVSTPPLPWDARIIGAAVHWGDNMMASAGIQLWATDIAYDNNAPLVMGDQLIGIAQNNEHDQPWGSDRTNNYFPVTANQANNLGTTWAAAALGTVVPVGKRVTWALYPDFPNLSLQGTLILTIERIGVLRVPTVTQVLDRTPVKTRNELPTVQPEPAPQPEPQPLPRALNFAPVRIYGEAPPPPAPPAPRPAPKPSGPAPVTSAKPLPQPPTQPTTITPAVQPAEPARPPAEQRFGIPPPQDPVDWSVARQQQLQDSAPWTPSDWYFSQQPQDIRPTAKQLKVLPTTVRPYG